MQLKSAFLLSLSGIALGSAVTPRTFGFWTIKNFTRNCTDPNICTYNFLISTPTGDQQCTTVDVATPATTHPWYDVPCTQASNWHISWGWDVPGDFTVMTVVKINQPDYPNTEAFFGYKSPNAKIPPTGGNASYADVGPNAVQLQ